MNIVCVSNQREALPSNLKKCFVLVNARRMTDEYRLRSYEPALCGPPRPAECPRSLPFAQPGLRAVRIFLLSRSGPHPGVIEKIKTRLGVVSGATLIPLGIRSSKMDRVGASGITANIKFSVLTLGAASAPIQSEQQRRFAVSTIFFHSELAASRATTGCASQTGQRPER